MMAGHKGKDNTMYTTYDAAIKALEEMEQDVVNDFGEKALDEGYYDIVHNVAADCTDEVARELLRTQLGLGIFPDDPDPLDGIRVFDPSDQPPVRDPDFDKRVKARVAEFRRKAYWSR